MGDGENTFGDLFLAASECKGVKVHESKWSPILVESADRNSKICATRGEGGHHNWEKRFQALKKTGLGAIYAEINAESWKWQELHNPVMLWKEAFKCWRQSPGHWSVASKRHKYFGAGLAKSKQGIWYMTIVVADGGDELPPEPEKEPEYKLW